MYCIWVFFSPEPDTSGETCTAYVLHVWLVVVQGEEWKPEGAYMLTSTAGRFALK